MGKIDFHSQAHDHCRQTGMPKLSVAKHRAMLKYLGVRQDLMHLYNGPGQSENYTLRIEDVLVKLVANGVFRQGASKNTRSSGGICRPRPIQPLNSTVCASSPQTQSSPNQGSGTSCKSSGKLRRPMARSSASTWYVQLTLLPHLRQGSTGMVVVDDRHRFTRSGRKRSRTSASGFATIRALVPTTCTRSTAR